MKSLKNISQRYKRDSKSGLFLSDTTDFRGGFDAEKPIYKSMRWNGKAEFGLELLGLRNRPTIDSSTSDRIKKRIDDIEWNFYGENEEGTDLEFEVIFHSKPSNDTVKFKVHGKGYIIEPQGLLTAQDIVNGCERPDDIINSYAIYHGKQGNEYKTGKFCHIKRFKIWSQSNPDNAVWCESELRGNNIEVTIPTDFYNSAPLPWVLDPTFGNTSIGGSSSNVNAEDFDVSKFALSEAGDVTDIYFRCFALYGDVNVKGVIYSDSSGPQTLQGVTSAVFASSMSNSWLQLNYSSSVSLTATDWWLGIIPDYSLRYLYDSTGGTREYGADGTYASPETTFPSGSSSSSRLVSIYAEYTTGGTPSTPDNNIFFFGGGL